MVENSLKTSSIFLTIVCCLIMVANFIFNFTFLVTLIKLRRLNRLDKSNFLLTHLIFADFLSSFFILVPSGYGVYNNNSLNFDGCRVQTFFTTFFLSITFQGLLVLTIERFIRYQFPVWHINNFTKRLYYDENERLVGNRQGHKVSIIIGFIWIYNIFVAFIPFFKNYNDIQYFTIQSQCDYIYENFVWWIWVFFWACLTVPFLAGIVFSILTLRLIFVNQRIVNIKKAQFDLEESRANKSLLLDSRENKNKSDITRQPGNRIFYEHIINPDEQEETIYNDFHVRNQLLAQYKYDTEKSKTITFLIILILNYIIVFPIFVIHFYRTYYNLKNGSDDYDDETVVKRSTYTAFAWISYCSLILKSFVCMVQNKFYRDALYQSANFRGFKGIFDFQKEFQKARKFKNSSKA